MTSIPPVGSQAQSSSATGSQANGLQSLSNPNTFLQLLVAQLKYQNPLNPTSGTQFLSQTGQLSEVEAVQSMSSEMTQELSAMNLLSTASLIGKTVTATLPSGTTVSGAVTGVNMSGANGPTLTVNGQQISPGSISSIT